MMFVFAERRGGSWLDNAVAYSLPLETRSTTGRCMTRLPLFLDVPALARTRRPTERIDPLLIQAGKTMAMRFMEKRSVPALVRRTGVAVH